jgi:CRISPR-associated protein Csx10
MVEVAPMLELALTFRSDWHVGSGSGRHGEVDRLVQRDRRGLPYVPGKTMTGIWRDACEVAARALDGGAAGGWSAWLEYLFGGQPALWEPGMPPVTPRPAALRVGSLHVPEPAGAVLAARPRVREATTFLKPGVRIDGRTGRAAPETLRWVEMARAGARLVGTADVAGFPGLEADQRRCVGALLVAGARLVERVGGKRRRGAGRCTFGVAGVDLDLEWLAGCDEPPAPPPWPAAETELPLPRPGTATAWEVAPLRLVLESPVVVQQQTVGNIVRSADVVPGRMMLSLVLRRLADPRAGEAARRGDLMVTDATAEVGSRPGWPLPLAFGVDGAWYAGTEGGRPVRARVGRVERTHNTVDDLWQRPTSDLGGVYTYQAIAAGTVLRAEVRVPAGLLPAGWQDRLPGVWRLGRSRKDDYGVARVSLVPAAATDRAPGTGTASVTDSEPGTVRPGAEGERGAAGPGRLRVWLLSDLLVLDRWLRPGLTPGDVAAELGRALGVRLRPVEDGGGVFQTSRTDSWHGSWGLPRPSLVGIAAGSVLDFEVLEGVVSGSAVDRVQLAGVGLRRGEGFGQVRINDPLVADLTATPAEVRAAATPAASDGTGELSETDLAWVGAAERAAWRSELHRRGEALAASTAGRTRVLGDGHADVPPTQRGSLRAVVAGLAELAADQVESWLTTLDHPRRARSWPQQVRDQLRVLLTDREEVWRIAGLSEQELSVSAGHIPELREQLWAVAVGVLVGDCLTALERTGAPE